jgi:hypothetical protein
MEGTMDISGRPHYFVYQVPKGALEWIGNVHERVPVAPTITGEITCEEGVTVPEGATVTMQLLEFSAGRGKRVLAEQRLDTADGIPISYKLRFDRSHLKMDRAHDYSLYATIWNKNRLFGGSGVLVRDGRDLILTKKDRVPVFAKDRVIPRIPIRVRALKPE